MRVPRPALVSNCGDLLQKPAPPRRAWPAESSSTGLVALASSWPSPATIPMPAAASREPLLPMSSAATPVPRRLLPAAPTFETPGPLLGVSPSPSALSSRSPSVLFSCSSLVPVPVDRCYSTAPKVGARRDSHAGLPGAPRKRARGADRWALRPTSNEMVSWLESELELVASTGAPATLAKDRLAWDRWSRYCAEVWGTDPMRTNRNAHEGRDLAGMDDEDKLQTGFILWLVKIVRPRSKRDSAAKPSSLLQNLSAVRRVHVRTWGIVMHKPVRLHLVFRRLLRKFVEANGPEALIPDRKQPAGASLLRRILEVPDGSKLGLWSLSWGSVLGTSLRAMLCLAFAGGFRKAELALPAGAEFDNMRISRASVKWRIGGVVFADPDAETLAMLSLGDVLIVVPPPSKSDPFGVYFGGRPLYLPYEPDNSINAAKALKSLELKLPVRGAARRSTPLFVSDDTFSPFLASRADSLLKQLLAWILDVEERAKYSWHSFRIGLACSLLAMGAPPELIQAMCRWKSADSLAIYARLNAEAYSSWVLKAQSATLSSIASRSLPQIDDEVHATILAQVANWEENNN